MKIRLEDIIRQHIHLPSIPSKKGWYQVLCPICNDHGKKGKRAGFKFDKDIIGYNCFNCDFNTIFDPNKYKSLSKNMVMLLNEFGINQEVLDNFALNNFNNTLDNKVITKKPINIEPLEIPLPNHFYELSEASKSDKWAILANYYLETHRLIDPKNYQFYLSTGEGKFGKKWKGRIIFPIYKNNILIFYQGRSLIPSLKRKYESPSTEKSRVLYNYEELLKYSEYPLFVVEGFFDAYLINGVAIFGKRLSKEQIIWLNKSHRKIIVIPDKYGDGQKLAYQAINNGWYVSTPDLGDSGDITDAIKEYGKLYVIDSIMKNISSGSKAEIRVKLYCN